MTLPLTPCFIAVMAVALAAGGSPAEAQSADAIAVIASPPPAGAVEGSGAGRFLRDVGGDYKHFFSKESARWLGVGAVLALTAHPSDLTLRSSLESGDAPGSLAGGQQYGGPAVQYPLAVGWWIVGNAMGSDRAADAGRDLLRAQISATSWTYAFKFAANRTRPNGDARSFPSGHASSTFATAMVLQQHYGWKLGLPAFAAAGYTAASRIVADKHWPSDVVFGAVLGMTSAWIVTVRLHDTRVSFAPWVVPGGGGVQVSAIRIRS